MTVKQRFLTYLIGFSILLMALLAGIAYGYLMPSFEQLDSNIELNNMELKYQLMLILWLAVLLLDLIVSGAIWRLFHSKVATFSAFLRLVYTLFLGLALVPLIKADKSFFSPEGLSILQQAIVAFKNYWSIGLIVFGFHLLSLSFVFSKTTYLKVLLQIAGWSYVLVHGGFFFWPQEQLFVELETILSLPMALAELLLAFILLLKPTKLL